jgi:hypothetical protein
MSTWCLASALPSTISAQEAEVQRQFSSCPSSRSNSPTHGLVAPDGCHPLAEAPTMLPPGRLLHITKDEHSAGGFRVAEVASDAFDEILISPRMLADHMPNYLGQVTPVPQVAQFTFVVQVFSSFPSPPAVEPLVL